MMHAVHPTHHPVSSGSVQDGAPRPDQSLIEHTVSSSTVCRQRGYSDAEQSLTKMPCNVSSFFALNASSDNAVVAPAWFINCKYEG